MTRIDWIRVTRTAAGGPVHIRCDEVQMYSRSDDGVGTDIFLRGERQVYVDIDLVPALDIAFAHGQWRDIP